MVKRFVGRFVVPNAAIFTSSKYVAIRTSFGLKCQKRVVIKGRRQTPSRGKSVLMHLILKSVRLHRVLLVHNYVICF